MSAGKILNTSNPLYSSITRALSGDVDLAKLVALKGGSDTALQPAHQQISTTVTGATWIAAQGIVRTDTNWFAISTSTIRKYDLVDNLLVTNSNAFTGLPVGVDHCGSGFVDGSFLYVPVVNYDSATETSTQQTIAKYNISDLTLDSYFDTSAQADCGGSGLALSIDGTEIYATSFTKTNGSDPRNEDVYRFNKSTGAYLGLFSLGSPCVGTQSMVYHPDRDQWFLGSYDDNNSINEIYIYDNAFNLITQVDPILSSVEMEGVCYYDGNIYFHHFNGSPRLLVLANLYISTVTSKSLPVNFLENSLITESNTVLMKIWFQSLSNFRSIFDNETYENDWEAWSEADADLQYRVDSSERVTDTASLAAGQYYILAFTWEKVGSNVTIKLGKDGVYVGTNALGTWVSPPSTGLWLGGVNPSNDQADNLYKDIIVFDKVLSDAELLDTYNNFDDLYTAESAGISITDTTTETEYASNNPVISLTSTLSFTEAVTNVNYEALNPTITLTGRVSINESTSNTQYTSLNPVIKLTPPPIGIVSTVCFNGEVVNLEYIGSLSNVSFNGTIRTKC